MWVCVRVCFLSFLFLTFFFRFGLFTFVALVNRGSPCEVISVTCESSWLSRHTIIYIIFFFYIYIFFVYSWLCFVEQIYISISIPIRMSLKSVSELRMALPLPLVYKVIVKKICNLRWISNIKTFVVY